MDSPPDFLKLFASEQGPTNDALISPIGPPGEDNNMDQDHQNQRQPAFQFPPVSHQSFLGVTTSSSSNQHHQNQGGVGLHQTGTFTSSTTPSTSGNSPANPPSPFLVDNNIHSSSSSYQQPNGSDLDSNRRSGQGQGHSRPGSSSSLGPISLGVGLTGGQPAGQQQTFPSSSTTASSPSNNQHHHQRNSSTTSFLTSSLVPSPSPAQQIQDQQLQIQQQLPPTSFYSYPSSHSHSHSQQGFEVTHPHSAPMQYPSSDPHPTSSSSPNNNTSSFLQQQQNQNQHQNQGLGQGQQQQHQSFSQTASTFYEGFIPTNSSSSSIPPPPNTAPAYQDYRQPRSNQTSPQPSPLFFNNRTLAPDLSTGIGGAGGILSGSALDTTSYTHPYPYLSVGAPLRRTGSNASSYAPSWHDEGGSAYGGPVGVNQGASGSGNQQGQGNQTGGEELSNVFGEFDFSSIVGLGGGGGNNSNNNTVETGLPLLPEGLTGTGTGGGSHHEGSHYEPSDYGDYSGTGLDLVDMSGGTGLVVRGASGVGSVGGGGNQSLPNTGGSGGDQFGLEYQQQQLQHQLQHGQGQGQGQMGRSFDNPFEDSGEPFTSFDDPPHQDSSSGNNHLQPQGQGVGQDMGYQGMAGFNVPSPAFSSHSDHHQQQQQGGGGGWNSGGGGGSGSQGHSAHSSPGHRPLPHPSHRMSSDLLPMEAGGMASMENQQPPYSGTATSFFSSSGGGQQIYAEPSSLPGTSSSELGVAPQVVQRLAGKNSLGALQNSLLDQVKGQSEFARRMNSESSNPDSVASDESMNTGSRRESAHSLRNNATGYASGQGGGYNGQQYPSAPMRPPPKRQPSGSSNLVHPFPFAPHLAGPNSSGGNGGNGKPQSPPQLIIPESPMKASAVPATNNPSFKAPGVPFSQGGNRPPQPSLNTLFPPSNPHVAYGSFLPNMSPIGPGGPSINIVPSTPTSALKEGVRGIWERFAAEAAEAQKKMNTNKGGSRDDVMTGGGGGSSAAGGAGQGKRRASDAGYYQGEQGQGQTPPQLNIVNSNQAFNVGSYRQQNPTDNNNQVSAFSSSFSLHPGPAPGQAHRQRSRSESQMDAILPDFLANMSPEEIQNMLVQASMLGQTDEQNQQGFNQGGIDPNSVGGGDSSAHSSNHSSPYYNSPGMVPDVSMDHQQLREFSPYGDTGSVPSSAPAWQSNQVIAGPETFGANFIMTNDGRRLEFGQAGAGFAVGPKGMSIVPSQIGSESEPSPPMFGNFAANQANWAGMQLGMMASLGIPTNTAGVRRAKSAGGQMASHRRAAQSEDLGRAGKWASAEGNQTANFLDAITNPADGSLVPPSGAAVGHPRTTQAISKHRRDASPYRRERSASNASSLSEISHRRSPSAASSVHSSADGDAMSGGTPAKTKVTTPATEMASKGRRTNDGQFLCPVPGCGSTFTRHFNLKGHLRSHNEERPFACTHPGCTKSFARQHDCKRHMQLHVGVKPFVCEGCSRTFARLDALSRHHKTEGGLECARLHPLPTNPDGTLLSESKYRAEMARREAAKQREAGVGPRGGKRRKSSGVLL